MTIDMKRPEGNRIIELKVRCGNDCRNESYINGDSYEYIVMEKDYPIVSTKYLLNEGDGYKVLKESYDKSKRYEGI